LVSIWPSHDGGPCCRLCVGPAERLRLRDKIAAIGRPIAARCYLCGKTVVDARDRGQRRIVCDQDCRRRVTVIDRRNDRIWALETPPAAVCAVCGRSLGPRRRSDARYCSTRCRVSAHRYATWAAALDDSPGAAR
jgi:endogenous inhibitor of DNA gyrase (YacG/DUF329 family)